MGSLVVALTLFGYSGSREVRNGRNKRMGGEKEMKRYYRGQNHEARSRMIDTRVHLREPGQRGCVEGTEIKMEHTIRARSFAAGQAVIGQNIAKISQQSYGGEERYYRDIRAHY
ncbi:hypothetical protein EK21DRAFT_118429 [Setomelanomma holmii]|uniref:Uncharacterized protein n=1 Tax=Setomelanomma holmii TaxID=210430 RepID=A0A9P4GW47_9PLEO|nr:hypothetical protein EK21DRAFT_118429 [Setomelanomma holmii]